MAGGKRKWQKGLGNVNADEVERAVKKIASPWSEPTTIPGVDRLVQPEDEDWDFSAHSEPPPLIELPLQPNESPLMTQDKPAEDESTIPTPSENTVPKQTRVRHRFYSEVMQVLT
jgi:hypothetical protein